MEIIISPWKVVLGGYALIGFDDYMPEDAVPSIGWKIAGESVSRPRAQFTQQFVFSPNVTNVAEFSRLTRFATHDAAMTFLLLHNTLLPTDVADAVITARNGAVLTLANAYLELTGNPRVVPGSYFAAAYRLIGGQLTVVTPGVPPADFTLRGEDGAPLTGEDGIPIEAEH